MADPTATEPTLNPRTTAVINIHWQRDIVTREGAMGPFFADEIEGRDTLTWIRGSNAFRFGVEVRREQDNNNLAGGARPEQAAAHAAEGTAPASDINASAAYREHLARVLTARALAEAAARAWRVCYSRRTWKVRLFFSLRCRFWSVCIWCTKPRNGFRTCGGAFKRIPAFTRRVPLCCVRAREWNRDSKET